MRFIEAVGPREADGLVARVYGEVKRDFALLRDPDGNSPFLAHSPHPELLAGMWSVLYETVLVEGAVRRADKEAVAAAVSRSNDCPFCVEAHALLSAIPRANLRKTVTTAAIASTSVALELKSPRGESMHIR